MKSYVTTLSIMHNEKLRIKGYDSQSSMFRRCIHLRERLFVQRSMALCCITKSPSTGAFLSLSLSLSIWNINFQLNVDYPSSPLDAAMYRVLTIIMPYLSPFRVGSVCARSRWKLSLLDDFFFMHLAARDLFARNFIYSTLVFIRSQGKSTLDFSINCLKCASARKKNAFLHFFFFFFYQKNVLLTFLLTHLLLLRSYNNTSLSGVYIHG